LQSTCTSEPLQTQARFVAAKNHPGLFLPNLMKRVAFLFASSFLSGALLWGLRVPNLAVLTDPQTASALVLRALALGTDLGFEGKKTQALASQLAAQNLRILKKPRWELIQGLGDALLYEGMKSVSRKGKVRICKLAVRPMAFICFRSLLRAGKRKRRISCKN
jgi:hypothetical protein